MGFSAVVAVSEADIIKRQVCGGLVGLAVFSCHIHIALNERYSVSSLRLS